VDLDVHGVLEGSVVRIPPPRVATRRPCGRLIQARTGSVPVLIAPLQETTKRSVDHIHGEDRARAANCSGLGADMGAVERVIEAGVDAFRCALKVE